MAGLPDIQAVSGNSAIGGQSVIGRMTVRRQGIQSPSSPGSAQSFVAIRASSWYWWSGLQGRWRE
jgi:hypothetical protein